MTKVFFQNPAQDDRKVRQDRLFNKRIDGEELKIMRKKRRKRFSLIYTIENLARGRYA